MPSAMPRTQSPIPLSSTPNPPTASPHNNARRASLKVLNRNINKIALGNLLFRTWYYSPYPDSIILGEEQTFGHVNVHGTVSGSGPTTKQHPQGSAKPHVNINGESESANERSLTSTSAKAPPIPCDRLHVCPYCFRYTPKPELYVRHLRQHNVDYDPHSSTHESGDSASPSSDMSEDTSTWPVPDSAIKVYEHNGYTVWDIDGEREKLYCQNLSLFGKLFLEQKSVFFDTGGFHYFVLTYTPPLEPTSSSSLSSKRESGQTRASGRRRASSTTTAGGATTAISAAGVSSDSPERTKIVVPADINLRTQVLGFFSKENLSWDANNLACILVFPPYQHRNLGQLLMAVSYKLSGWEWEDSIIGGPEKPLSSMGRKSYLRFWSERVARFMMGQTADADGRRVFDSNSDSENENNDDNNDDDNEGSNKKRKRKRKKKRRKVGHSKEEMTVKEIGDRTGMLAEDVMAALNEMEILQVMTPPKTKKRKSGGDETATAVAAGGEGDGGSGGAMVGDEQATVLSSMVVHRSKVLEWARQRGVDLVSPVKEEGFLGEWALSEVDEDEADDEEVEESE